MEKERQEQLAEEARVEAIRKEQEALRLAEERAERWRSHSLKTGMRPFSGCWRSGLSGECGVEVTSAGLHEVLVTMKRGNEEGPVFGHVYVAAGGTGSIKVDPGVYQVFFSQGKGWDPEKVNPIPGCKEKGWFVDFYGVTKDDPENFKEGNFWTYELQPVVQGNFRANDSDPVEAF